MKSINLFDELLISEEYLAILINKYVFPEQTYKKQIEVLKLKWQEAGKDKNENNRKTVLNNKSKIKFRTKHIIFMGYSNVEQNKFYFFITTTKEPQTWSTSLFINQNDNKTIYVNLDKLYFLNFNQIKFKNKSINENRNVDYFQNWKYYLIRNIRKKILNDLTKNTSITIYKKEFERIKSNKEIKNETKNVSFLLSGNPPDQ